MKPTAGRRVIIWIRFGLELLTQGDKRTLPGFSQRDLSDFGYKQMRWVLSGEAGMWDSLAGHRFPAEFQER